MNRPIIAIVTMNHRPTIIGAMANTIFLSCTHFTWVSIRRGRRQGEYKQQSQIAVSLSPSMSSFKRRVQAQQSVNIKGTQPVVGAPSLVQVSTGVSSIDDLLGGGLPLGHTLMILAPDENSAWGELVSRYFIAQGLSSEHSVLVCDPQPDRLVSGCMWYPGTKTHETLANNDEANAETTSDKVTIAWRYEQMKQFKTTVDDKNGGCVA